MGRILRCCEPSPRPLATIWITGNHDPAPPGDIGGTIVAEVALGPVTLRHEPRPLGDGMLEIAGHLHPAATVVQRGHRIRCRCFIADDRRIVMPAFGSYTGALERRVRRLRGAVRRLQVWMLGSTRHSPLPGRAGQMS